MMKKNKLAMLAILEDVYRGETSALHFSNPFELLVAVILSAQCTDKRVNQVTESLFKKANTPEKFLEFGLENLEREIFSCGFYKNKAKNILHTCEILCEKFGGSVPENYEDLLTLPGVGRKTANVVSSIAFGRDAIAVDTHVFRVANRTELGKGDTPEKVEEALQKIIPKEKWSQAHHWLIWHGRKICHSRKPSCEICLLNELCPSKEKF